MFTGIVREKGRVAALGGGAAGLELTIAAPDTARTIEVGGSVAIDGVCLTAETVAPPQLTFRAVPETLTRTTLGSLAVGDAVNLEPALRAGEPLGGHIVQGHVDGVGTVRTVADEGDGARLTLAAPAELVRYCVEKGSITVDGVSLTVAAVEPGGFAVALIPHTLAATTLGEVAPGDRVNLEVDVLAKYVERLVAR
ncbi:MAG: riboflavin synthase [Gaiellales bacterium]